MSFLLPPFFLLNPELPARVDHLSSLLSNIILFILAGNPTAKEKSLAQKSYEDI